MSARREIFWLKAARIEGVGVFTDPWFHVDALRSAMPNYLSANEKIVAGSVLYDAGLVTLGYVVDGRFVALYETD